MIISQRDINKRQKDFKQLAINERQPPPKIIQFSGSRAGARKDVRRAKLTASAGATATITANLYNKAGVEQIVGDEAGVTIYCLIMGGEALNEAEPRLVEGKEIFITATTYNNEGTPEQRWYCTDIFQACLDYEWI